MITNVIWATCHLDPLVLQVMINYQRLICNFPYQRALFLGGMIGSQMVYCGGWAGYQFARDDCSYYYPESNIWIETEQELDMIKHRYYAGYASTDHGLLVTGGYNFGSCYYNYAEYLSKAGEKWESLQDVTFHSIGACLVQLNSTHTLHIGGQADTDCHPAADSTNR